MYYVLGFLYFILKDFTLFNSVFKCCSISLVHEFKDLIVVNRVISSAYITYLNVLLDFSKLLTYITKGSGPIMEFQKCYCQM